MKNYLLWLVPAIAGLMLLQATKHVYTHSQPVTRLEPPRTPPRTMFANSIAATGILEPASQNIAVGSALLGRGDRGLRVCRAGRYASEGRRSAVSSGRPPFTC